MKRYPVLIRRLFKVALELHLEGMAEDGDALPEPSVMEYVEVAEPKVTRAEEEGLAETPPRNLGKKTPRGLHHRKPASDAGVENLVRAGKATTGPRPKSSKHPAKQPKRP